MNKNIKNQEFITPEKFKKEGQLLGFLVLIPNKGVVEILRPSIQQYWGGYESFQYEAENDIEFHNYASVCIRKIKKETIPLSLRFKILQRDNFKCQYCGRSAKDGAILEIDHIVPKSKGGTDDPENLITACRECNRGKGNKILKEGINGRNGRK